MTDTSGTRSELRIGFRPVVCGPIYAVPSRYWLPHSGPLRKAAAALGAVALAESAREHTGRRGEQNSNAMTLNRLTLIRFVGADAETRSNSNGSQYTIFSIPTKTSWKNADGA